MKLFSALAATAAVVLTQQDGGTASRSVPPATDGGVTYKVLELEKPDVHAAEIAQLKQDLAAMRASLQQMNTKLDAAVKELEATRQQQAAQQARVDASRSAAVSLGALDQQLATGNTAVDGTLRQLEESLGPSARANIEAARNALSNNDLTSARTYLAQAAADAQAGR